MNLIINNLFSKYFNTNFFLPLTFIKDYVNRRFTRSILTYLLLIFLIISAIPVVLIIRLISPIYLIRIGGLWNQHIGHYAMCTELYLCKRDLEKNVVK